MEWDGLEIMDISRFNRLLNVEPGNFNSAKKLEGISLSNFEKYGSAKARNAGLLQRSLASVPINTLSSAIRLK